MWWWRCAATAAAAAVGVISISFTSSRIILCAGNLAIWNAEMMNATTPRINRIHPAVRFCTVRNQVPRATSTMASKTTVIVTPTLPAILMFGSLGFFFPMVDFFSLPSKVMRKFLNQTRRDDFCFFFKLQLYCNLGVTFSFSSSFSSFSSIPFAKKRDRQMEGEKDKNIET